MKNDYLRIIWFKKASKYSTDAHLINSTFDELMKRYNEDKRFYHDLSHVVDLLKLLEENHFRINDEDVVYYSIWFHDAVYESLRNDNEEKSAEWAAIFLNEIHFPPDRTEKVRRYILATKTHDTTGENDLNYFLDFDMSILGAEETIYDVYTRQVRDEFPFYPTFLYNRGRKKALQEILRKQTIYSTEEYKNRLENISRENMQRELSHL